MTYLLGTTRSSAVEGRGKQKHLVVCMWPVTATGPMAYDNILDYIIFFARQEVSQEFQGNLLELPFFFQTIVVHRLQQIASALLQHTKHNSISLEVNKLVACSECSKNNVFRHLCPCHVLYKETCSPHGTTLSPLSMASKPVVQGLSQGQNFFGVPIGQGCPSHVHC